MNTYALFYIDQDEIETLKREIFHIFETIDEIGEGLFIIHGGEDTENLLKLSFQVQQSIFDSAFKGLLKIFIYSGRDSPDDAFWDFAISIMTDYDCSLSLNHTSFAQLSNPNIYNFRFLGLFPTENPREDLSVFDFIDCTQKDLTNAKIDSKAVFEDSVFNFYNNRIPQSIAGFYNVLQLYPEDKASMKYIERGNNLLSK